MPELNLPTPGVTAGPEWASQLNTAISTINDEIDTIRNTLLDGLRLARVTQAEYDALPTPRPGDVLYVIVN